MIHAVGMNYSASATQSFGNKSKMTQPVGDFSTEAIQRIADRVGMHKYKQIGIENVAPKVGVEEAFTNLNAPTMESAIEKKKGSIPKLFSFLIF